MKEIGARLASCLASGNLTVADLARWFGRPHPTVRGWIVNGFDPRGGPHDVEHVFSLLTILEKQIKSGRVLPFKRGLSRAARIRYIGELRRDVDNRLSKKDLAR